MRLFYCYQAGPKLFSQIRHKLKGKGTSEVIRDYRRRGGSGDCLHGGDDKEQEEEKSFDIDGRPNKRTPTR